MVAESIFIRVQRVLSAGAETAVEGIERASSTSLMREAIRQVDRAADEVRADHEAAINRRLHATRQQQLIRDRIATLKEQASFAMSKGREDLAQATIARQIDYEKELERQKTVQSEASDEARRLEESMAALKVRRTQMEKEMAAFQAAQREAASAAVGETPVDVRAERKVARAEAAFERAMAAAGAAGVGLADAESAAKLSEVEALQKDAAIEARLAALRAQAAAAAAPAAKKPKQAKAR